jgi:multidrug efflux pump subunit AcrB
VVETGDFLRSAADARQLVVGIHDQRPVYLSDVAQVRDGPPQPSDYVWIGTSKGEHPAVTVQVTKKPGQNAVDVSDRVMQRVAELHGTVIPDEVRVTETRNYGATANAKALKLIEKLIFATVSVVLLVLATLGRREALIVGLAVMLTLATTLFASWAWGFTLNRVSLFALIFSIGILVDDAIVVVENIHRHRAKAPETPLSLLIPLAVDEVGGPTILATFTVIAALLPMAFVTGLMGPYMSPIPINASMGMLISLAIAFSVTPWLACRFLGKGKSHGEEEAPGSGKLDRFFGRVLGPFIDSAKNRLKLWIGILVLILLSLSLAGVKLVILKMLPFDNKSEFQVVVDMPAGTPVEITSAVLHDMGAYLATVPEVTNYEAYAGTHSPINFNGLVRQYYLRSDSEQGDLQVNLKPKGERDRHSHEIAQSVRPELEKIAARWNAKVKVVEVPPGPPVMSPIVAEVYGPDEAGRIRTAERVKAAFAATPGIVSIDDSVADPAPRVVLRVDQAKAALLGVSARDVVETMRMGLLGDDVTPIHDGHSKYEVPVRIELPPERQGHLDELLKLALRTTSGALVPLSEVVKVVKNERDRPIYHKDLLPVVYVVGDEAGRVDSPLYGMFAIRGKVVGKPLADGGVLGEYFIHQPSDPYRQFSIKWDGEWQITYETFRDMGIAYAVGLILIYLLVVAQFRSYLTPLIIMAPIPLTVIGVLPGHALLGANFTATSMIGMIALAGIIVRNSILLVDFVNERLEEGAPLRDAVLHSAAARAKPIVLTGLAAMIGATFILDDPIFQGLAISLIFGIFVSTVLTLVVIPVLYYVAMKRKLEKSGSESN